MELKDSITFNNLQIAYNNSLKDNGKYDLYSKRAGQEAIIEIQDIFETTSGNELFISERLRNILSDGTPNTLGNLIEARNDAAAESSQYRDFANVAEEEGFSYIASLLHGIANIKLNHESLFQNFITNIENNELFCKTQESLWICLGCGNILSGVCAPNICPICGYPQGYYRFLRSI